MPNPPSCTSRRAAAVLRSATKTSAPVPLTYYPATQHHLHPLHNSWLKLPASVIQTLHVPDGFHSTILSENSATLSLYHHINHPVPFVDVCGLIVGCEFLALPGCWSLLIDDGSGTVLEVLVRKGTEGEESWLGKVRGGDGRLAGPGELIAPPVPEWKGRGWVGGEEVDLRKAEVGKVLRVKGRVKEWKGKKQVVAERIFPVRTTSEEVRFWRSMCETFEFVLSKPWHLSEREQRRLRDEADEAQRKQGERLEKRRRRLRDGEPASHGASGRRRKSSCERVKQATARRMRPSISDAITDPDPKRSELVNSERVIAAKFQTQSNLPAERVLDELWPRQSPSLVNAEAVGEQMATQLPIAEVVPESSPPAASSPPKDGRVKASITQARKQTGCPVIISRSSPSQWTQLDLEMPRSSEPPPGNQQAFENLLRDSSTALIASTMPNGPPAAEPQLQIVNNGLPSEWDAVDLGLDAATKNASTILHGRDWLQIRARESIQTGADEPDSRHVENSDVLKESNTMLKSLDDASEGAFRLFDWKDEWDRVEL